MISTPSGCGSLVSPRIVVVLSAVSVHGQEVITSAGGSYYLPAGTLYGLTVLEELLAVEVLSLPLQNR